MKIAIIGGGNMGRALAQQLSQKHAITLYDRHPEKMNPVCTLSQAVEDAELVFLAVKPQNVEEIAIELSPLLKKEQMLISLLTGTTLKKLATLFPKPEIVRMMPNLAIAYGVGVVAMTKEAPVDHSLLTTLLEPLGQVHWIAEDQMNAFTALAASGPGFFFALLEAMIEAGTTMGFSQDESTQLVHEMVSGSVKLLAASGKSERELIDNISSRGGTTRAGLDTFQQCGVKESIIKTFLKAKEHAKELQQ